MQSVGISVGQEKNTVSTNKNDYPVAAPSVSEYQSILLTRYLKEPRLPPSSTYYNNSYHKKKQAISRVSRPFL
jgi:hypothetical protein